MALATEKRRIAHSKAIQADQLEAEVRNVQKQKNIIYLIPDDVNIRTD